MKRWITVWLTTMMVVIICIPALALWLTDGMTPRTEVQLIPLQEDDDVIVPVYLSHDKKVMELPLEKYVRGVVAAEMPASFELEALKAQALVARTYIIRRMAKEDNSNVPGGAYVTDTILHQVHLTEEQLKEKWGALGYVLNMNKIHQAVNATKGQVIVYEGEPINATFFSTSNGYTENSEDYWRVSEPYLRSVASPWDADSPKFEATTRWSLQQFQERMGIRLSPSLIKSGKFMQVLEQSPGRRVKQAQVGNKVFTGREIRERLELPSSQFSWKVEGKDIIFKTLGYGHGVGMSQYGAQGMALEGKTYQQIVKHYYQGVEITKLEDIAGMASR
jgi:stage II sporulation protein D